MTRLLRYAPFLALGPITGPIMARATYHATHKAPILAALYVCMAAEFWALAPLVLGAEMHALKAML
jgi:hypothetical protein